MKLRETHSPERHQLHELREVLFLQKTGSQAVCSPPSPSENQTLSCPASQRLGSREFACSAGDPGGISGLGRSPGVGNDNPTPVLMPGKIKGQRGLAG